MNHASGGDGFWHRARFARLGNAVRARSWRARRTWPAAAVSSARMRAPTAFSATQSGRGGGHVCPPLLATLSPPGQSASLAHFNEQSREGS